MKCEEGGEYEYEHSVNREARRLVPPLQLWTGAMMRTRSAQRTRARRVGVSGNYIHTLVTWM